MPLKPTRRSCSKPKYSDRKSTRLNSSHSQISYAVFCLKKKTENGEDVDTVVYHGLQACDARYLIRPLVVRQEHLLGRRRTCQSVLRSPALRRLLPPHMS